MKYENAKVAGALLFVGGVQWFFGIVIAEGLHPSYSSRINYISTLGREPTSLLFNLSLVLLGVMGVAGAYFIQRGFDSKFLFVLLTLTGIGAIGVGLFPETIQPTHGIFQAFALICGAFSAIISYKLQKPPFSYISVLLGALSLVSLVVFYPYLGLAKDDPVTFLGLGKGGMERLIIYPILIWIASFGSHLIGYSKNITAKS